MGGRGKGGAEVGAERCGRDERGGVKAAGKVEG